MLERYDSMRSRHRGVSTTAQLPESASPYWQAQAMDITAPSIIEGILDPLMFSDLADESLTVNFRRLADNVVELDFGLPDRLFVLTVEERPRA
jgi:hypothetical protein